MTLPGFGATSLFNDNTIDLSHVQEDLETHNPPKVDSKDMKRLKKESCLLLTFAMLNSSVIIYLYDKKL